MFNSFSAAQAARFHQQGFVHLGQLLDADMLAALQARIDDIMLGKIRYEGMLMQLDSDSGRYEELGEQSPGFKGATLNYRKIEQLEKDPLFLAYLQSPLIRSITATLIGDEVSIYRSMFMNKPAGFGTLLPWHQDGGTIWNLNQDPEVTIWLALDPATKENGCVQIIPGSHKLGLLSSFGHTISAEQEARHCTDTAIQFCELQAGEAFLIHNHVLHRSDKNSSLQSRRAFSVCLMDATTKHRQQTERKFPLLFSKQQGTSTLCLAD